MFSRIYKISIDVFKMKTVRVKYMHQIVMKVNFINMNKTLHFVILKKHVIYIFLIAVM